MNGAVLFRCAVYHSPESPAGKIQQFKWTTTFFPNPDLTTRFQVGLQTSAVLDRRRFRLVNSGSVTVSITKLCD